MNAAHSLEASFMQPFLVASVQVLSEQAMTKSTPGKVFTKSKNEKYSGDISGVIEVVSNNFKATVAVSFPEDTYLKVMSRMLGEEYSTLTPDIEDGAAEIMNMIFGQAKVELNKKGLGIQMARPIVIKGNAQVLTPVPKIVVPFSTDVGAYFIEICCSL